MNKGHDFIRKARLAMTNITKELSIAQLNEIPAGFNNNIAWNMAHLIATQQIVCYRRAGIDTVVDAEFVDTYAPGTRPERFITEEEVLRIVELFSTSLDRYELDMHAGLFNNYTAWTTRAGVDVNNINDADAFLPYHEGMHVGYIMALKKLVSKAQ
ncbi:DinB family protein [Mucilaginibacter calamicampi]|uniref:DinB family protein n=1 Tax=Mucilaginibacter calamicampi TaxID=1302352 RepID=A0ABW2YTP5_9SPHI